MTIKPTLLQELDRLAATAAGGPLLLDMPLPTGRVRGTFTDIQPLACGFEQLAVSAPGLAHASLDQLKSVAEELARRLSYLLEAVAPLEIDQEGCVVQMRSKPPEKDDDGTRYYELLVSKSTVSLARYQKAAGQPRQVIPATVTREVLCRLADDLLAAVP